jgi:hypothetical protein
MPHLSGATRDGPFSHASVLRIHRRCPGRVPGYSIEISTYSLSKVTLDSFLGLVKTPPLLLLHMQSPTCGYLRVFCRRHSQD